MKTSENKSEIERYFCKTCNGEMIDSFVSHDACIKDAKTNLAKLKKAAKEIKNRMALSGNIELRVLKLLVDLKIKDIEKFKRLQ